MHKTFDVPTMSQSSQAQQVTNKITQLKHNNNEQSIAINDLEEILENIQPKQRFKRYANFNVNIVDRKSNSKIQYSCLNNAGDANSVYIKFTDNGVTINLVYDDYTKIQKTQGIFCYKLNHFTNICKF